MRVEIRGYRGQILNMWGHNSQFVGPDKGYVNSYEIKLLPDLVGVDSMTFDNVANSEIRVLDEAGGK